MKKRIITISRQFGSRGHSIGEAVANQIGIPCYDKQILDRIAAETGLAPGYIKEASEYASANNSLLWNLVIGRRKGDAPEENPADIVYFAQAKIIRELVEQDPCVIIGRCSDYILRDRDDCLHIFICAGKHSRAKHILEQYGDSSTPIEKRISDKDTRRSLYYSHYTDQVWGSPENYHATLNSGALGEEACIQIIRELYQTE